MTLTNSSSCFINVCETIILLTSDFFVDVTFLFPLLTSCKSIRSQLLSCPEIWMNLAMRLSCAACVLEAKAAYYDYTSKDSNENYWYEVCKMFTAANKIRRQWGFCFASRILLKRGGSCAGGGSGGGKSGHVSADPSKSFATLLKTFLRMEAKFLFNENSITHWHDINQYPKQWEKLLKSDKHCKSCTKSIKELDPNNCVTDWVELYLVNSSDTKIDPKNPYYFLSTNPQELLVPIGPKDAVESSKSNLSFFARAKRFFRPSQVSSTTSNMVTYRNFEWMIHHLLQVVGSDGKRAVFNDNIRWYVVNIADKLEAYRKVLMVIHLSPCQNAARIAAITRTINKTGDGLIDFMYDEQGRRLRRRGQI